MIRKPFSRSKPPRPIRTGSVALVLVLVLTLAVGTFAASVTRLASHERHLQSRQEMIATLEAAIDAVVESELFDDGTETRISLPLDPILGRRIVVQRVNSSSEIQATFFQNATPGLSLRRNIP